MEQNTIVMDVNLKSTTLIKSMKEVPRISTVKMMHYFK